MTVDTHTPAQAAAWLRKRAVENRHIAALPPDAWPTDAGVLLHLAFRFEQIAELIERMHEWRCRMIAIPSPSSVCGLLGCRDLHFHVHDIEGPASAADVSSTQQEKT